MEINLNDNDNDDDGHEDLILFTHKAKFMGIPIWWVEGTDVFVGTNWFYELMVDVALFVITWFTPGMDEDNMPIEILEELDENGMERR